MRNKMRKHFAASGVGKSACKSAWGYFESVVILTARWRRIKARLRLPFVTQDEPESRVYQFDCTAADRPEVASSNPLHALRQVIQPTDKDRALPQ